LNNYQIKGARTARFDLARFILLYSKRGKAAKTLATDKRGWERMKNESNSIHCFIKLCVSAPLRFMNFSG